MGERKQLNITVDADDKEAWKEYAEKNPNTESLTQLIKLAVLHEMESDEPEMPASSSKDSDDLGEILQEVRGIRSDMNVLTTRIEAIERSVERSPEKSKVAQRIWDVLPTEEPGTTAHEALVAQDRTGDKVPYATVGNLADRLGETESVVRDALTRLQDDMHPFVRVTEWNGSDVYWRDE